MKLMCRNEVIADTVKIDNMYYLKLRDGVEPIDVPFGLFMKSKYEDLFRIQKWASTRCFPPDRFGADELLKELGLDRYDPWEIVKKTGARMTGLDEFWIDFERGKKKHKKK